MIKEEEGGRGKKRCLEGKKRPEYDLKPIGEGGGKAGDLPLSIIRRKELLELGRGGKKGGSAIRERKGKRSSF